MSRFSFIKKFLHRPSILRNLMLWMAMAPPRPGVLMAEENASGLRLLHIAGNTIEADLLRQVLHDAGFYTEHVPSVSTAIVGANLDCCVYARKDQYDEALAFLHEYLNSPLLSEE